MIVRTNRPQTNVAVKWFWHAASLLSFVALAIWCVARAVPPVHGFITPPCHLGSACANHRRVPPFGILPAFFTPLYTVLISLFAQRAGQKTGLIPTAAIKRAHIRSKIAAVIIATAIAAIGFLAVFAD